MRGAWTNDGKTGNDLRLFLQSAREQSLSGRVNCCGLNPATLGGVMARLERTMSKRCYCEISVGVMPLTERGRSLLAGRGRRSRRLRPGTAKMLPCRQISWQGPIKERGPDGVVPTICLPQVCARLVAKSGGLNIQIVALAARVQPVAAARADMAIGVSGADGGSWSCEKLPTITASCRCAG